VYARFMHDYKRAVENKHLHMNNTRTHTHTNKNNKNTATILSFCMSFYGMVLWKYFTAGAINRLQSCYRKCMKTFLVTPEVTVYRNCYACTAWFTHF